MLVSGVAGFIGHTFKPTMGRRPAASRNHSAHSCSYGSAPRVRNMSATRGVDAAAAHADAAMAPRAAGGAADFLPPQHSETPFSRVACACGAQLHVVYLHYNRTQELIISL